jgi:ABC-type amino acid transport substrate-binding protein
MNRGVRSSGDVAQPIFPTQVWLIARADSSIQPIEPSGDIGRDIEATKVLLKGHSVFGKANSCLDPTLHGLGKYDADVRLFEGALNELAPAVIAGEAEATILDVPDALIAMEKWPGKIKVIGPVTKVQTMSCAFAKSSPELRAEFEVFFKKCCADGTYKRLVEKYYPRILRYYPEFFESVFPDGSDPTSLTPASK